MTAKYLLSDKGLVALAQYIAADTLFAFDLDTALAAIVDEHAAARIGEPIRATLERLARTAKVALITGRSRKDALNILGFEPQLLVGNHGAEWPDQESGRNWQQIKHSLKWQEQLYDMIDYVQGIDIEFKGESLSVHYCNANVTADQAISQINAAIGKLVPSPKIINGRSVINLLPAEAVTKGDALVTAMNMFGARRAVFIGDDTSDEDIFQLNNVDLFGIYIGNCEETAAPYYLRKQSALLGLLNSMVGILEAQIEEIRG